MELLIDDVWEADDDKPVFLSAGADFVDQLFLHKWPISLPVVEDSNEIRKHDKWEKMKNINKLKNCENINFDECWRLFFDVTPAWKRSKIGKCDHIYLDRYPKSFFGKTPFYLKGCNFWAQTLRAILSNKNRILHFWIKSIIQYLQNCAPIFQITV